MLNISQIVYLLNDENETKVTCCNATIKAACKAVVMMRSRFLLADTIADVVSDSRTIFE